VSRAHALVFERFKAKPRRTGPAELSQDGDAAHARAVESP